MQTGIDEYFHFYFHQAFLEDTSKKESKKNPLCFIRASIVQLME